MRSPRIAAVLIFLSALLAVAQSQENSPAAAPSTSSASSTAAPAGAAGSFDDVVVRLTERERYFNEQIRRFHPLIETYIQNLKSDDEIGAVPTSDQYFLSRLDVSSDKDDRFLSKRSRGLRSTLGSVNKFSALYSMHFMPSG